MTILEDQLAMAIVDNATVGGEEKPPMDTAGEIRHDAAPARDSQPLQALARCVRGTGWLLGFVILVVGTVMAARANAQVALLLRVTLAGAVVALTSAAAWLISRYADRRAAR